MCIINEQMDLQIKYLKKKKGSMNRLIQLGNNRIIIKKKKTQRSIKKKKRLRDL